MDVDFLKAHSEKQRHTIFIDSSMRNKAMWPTPAEFSLDFETPLNYVVNVNILDASIPASTYSVDSHNNTLCILHRSSGSALVSPDAFTAGFLDIYRAHRFVRSVFEDETPGAEVINVANNRDVTGVRLRLYTRNSPDPALQEAGDVASLRQTTSTLESIIVIAPGTTPWVPALDAATASAPPDPANFVAPDRVLLLLPDGRNAVFDPTPIWPANEPQAVSRTAVYHIAERDAVLSIVRTVAGFSADTRVACEHEVTFHNIAVEPGEYDIKGLVEALNYHSPYLKQDATRRLYSVSSGSKQHPNSQSASFLRYSKQLQLDFTVPAILDMRKSTIGEVLGFAQPTASVNRVGYERATCNPDNAYLFQAIKPHSMANTYSALAPGVVNLTTSRFVVMRCPEIEDRFPALATGNISTGIGIFKLYDQTISHLRFDFVNFVKMDFHPIGKLQRLHFRFERPSGTLYDFKGVDFHVLVSFEFLQPTKARTTADYVSPLNPSYDPDVLKYIVNRDAPAHTRGRVGDKTPGPPGRARPGADEPLLDDPEHRRRFLIARNKARDAKQADDALNHARGGGGRGAATTGDRTTAGRTDEYTDEYTDGYTDDEDYDDSADSDYGS